MVFIYCMFEFLLFIICHIKGPWSLEWALEQDCSFSMPDKVHSNWVREHSAANNSDSPAAVVVSTSQMLQRTFAVNSNHSVWTPEINNNETTDEVLVLYYNPYYAEKFAFYVFVCRKLKICTYLCLKNNYTFIASY